MISEPRDVPMGESMLSVKLKVQHRCTCKKPFCQKLVHPEISRILVLINQTKNVMIDVDKKWYQ